FQCFFTTGAELTGPWCPASPIFNAADVVDSRYVDDTIPQQLLLEPYPEFDGGFEGLPTLNANSWYHSLQIRFQKRASHYISLEETTRSPRLPTIPFLGGMPGWATCT